jgi:hypothetical protein
MVPVPSTLTLHVGGPPVSHAGELETNVVPMGAESVTTIGAVVVAEPVFDTVSV